MSPDQPSLREQELDIALAQALERAHALEQERELLLKVLRGMTMLVELTLEFAGASPGQPAAKPTHTEGPPHD
jgi:hypothetical protein